jgi:hypothetical protein
MRFLAEVEQQLLSWPEVSVHPHRFGGQFRFRAAEIGHVHTGGIVDIPFPRAIRDALLAEGLAEEHHWVPNSGWVTCRIRVENDLRHALRLMRLSYLCYVLKTAADPAAMLEKESKQLDLSPRFVSLLEAFLPKSTRQSSAQSSAHVEPA